MKFFYKEPISSDREYGVVVGEFYNASAYTRGENSIAIASGPFSSACTSGENSIAIASGFCSQATAIKADEVAIAWGFNSKVKGVEGSTLIFKDSQNGRARIIAKLVDGQDIKANTFYKLSDSELTEV